MSNRDMNIIVTFTDHTNKPDTKVFEGYTMEEVIKELPVYIGSYNKIMSIVKVK